MYCVYWCCSILLILSAILLLSQMLYSSFSSETRNLFRLNFTTVCHPLSILYYRNTKRLLTNYKRVIQRFLLYFVHQVPFIFFHYLACFLFSSIHSFLFWYVFYLYYSGIEFLPGIVFYDYLVYFLAASIPFVLNFYPLIKFFEVVEFLMQFA